MGDRVPEIKFAHSPSQSSPRWNLKVVRISSYGRGEGVFVSTILREVHVIFRYE